MLKIHNLSFDIDGKLLFDTASAVIPTGHKVGIVGRNGSGKTTLFRLIRKEWEVDGGQIEVPADFRIGGVDQEAPAGASWSTPPIRKSAGTSICPPSTSHSLRINRNKVVFPDPLRPTIPTL